jgi:hypothetical protein
MLEKAIWKAKKRTRLINAEFIERAAFRVRQRQGGERWRLAAAEIERAVSAGARTMLGDRAAIALVLDESGIDSSHLVPVLKSTQTLIERLQADGETVSSHLPRSCRPLSSQSIIHRRWAER